jgi:hypothetical protein
LGGFCATHRCRRCGVDSGIRDSLHQREACAAHVTAGRDLGPVITVAAAIAVAVDPVGVLGPAFAAGGRQRRTSLDVAAETRSSSGDFGF